MLYVKRKSKEQYGIKYTDTGKKEKKAVEGIAMTFIDRLDANICRNNQIYFNERSKIT